ncbi:MAG: nitroreductase family protein [Candidatus Bathyarchaeia archaeon]
MDVLEAIRTRVSVRRYKPDPVPEAMIETVLGAACRAPSGANQQPWRFIVIRNPDTKRMIGEISVKGGAALISPKVAERVVRSYRISDPERRRAVIQSMVTGSRYRFIGEVPVLIAACADTSVSPRTYMLDTSAAIENMLLAAHGLGLGACWTMVALLNPSDEAGVKRILGVPNHVKVVAIVTLGFPSRVPRPRPRKGLGEVTFYERYGQTSPRS